jgi:hypothetical protein
LLYWVCTDRVVPDFLRAVFGSHVPGPVNVASGSGATILETALRVIALSGSRSPVQILPFRDAEVTRFVADISLGRQQLGLPLCPDPLSHLAAMCARPQPFELSSCRGANAD